MTTTSQPENRVKQRRLERQWSQAELAQRAGISRTAVTAIEGRRLIPSVAAALALAAALGCTVEELFGKPAARPSLPEWAWPPARIPSRFWQAQVGERTLAYPVESDSAFLAHDGVAALGSLPKLRAASETLVLACCDPAAGLLATEYQRTTGFRLLVLNRSSRRGLQLLRQGLVHVAGLHLTTRDQPQGNRDAVRETLGNGFELMRVAHWQEGLALAVSHGIQSVAAATRSRLRWVGREAGSGARQCLDELLAGRHLPRRTAADHRGVAEAIRSGWADIGVCHRLACEAAGLAFLEVRQETYELCFAAATAADPRLQALRSLLRSARLKQLLGDLPGYDVREIGEEDRVE